MRPRNFATTKADPATMPDNGLRCAIVACHDSQHLSDRQFARDCEAELERRAFGRPRNLSAMRMAATPAQRMRSAA